MSEHDEITADPKAPLTATAMPTVPPLIDYLPPWREANYRQRMRLTSYYFVIYLPVALLLLVVVAVFTFYFGWLLWPMAIGGDDRPELYFWHTSSERRNSRILACIFAVLQVVLLLLFLISFYKAALTNPGSIPDTGDWAISEKTGEDSAQAKLLLERKLTTGAIRTCARCNKVKPDRCHHCRLCDQCILKMDHHCPWIANCVGFFNYKYFFLMVTYGTLALWLFLATFWMAVVIILRDDESSVFYTLGIMIVYLLCGVLCTALTLFWGFHVYLILKATTTVEFCEKRSRTHDSSASPYLGSALYNLKAALGQQPLLWLIPFCIHYLGYRTEKETGTVFNPAATSV